MNMTINILRFALALIAVAMALPGVAQDRSLWTYKGADRLQKLADAARKEGSLTLYTSIAQNDLAPLIVPFEQKYGIPVKIWRSGSENVLRRTVSEASAKRYTADAVHSTAIELESLHQEKLLQPINSSHHNDLVPGALPSHLEWAATYLAVWVQTYNTNVIKKEDLPKSWEDLLHPKWKGKLGIESDVSQWYSTVVLDMGEEKGLRFFNDLVKRNGMSVRKGHSLLNNLVVSGEVPLALTVYNYMPESAKKKGAPVDWFVLEPAVAAASGVAVLRHAPHPNAALLFYEYMLGPEAQNVLLSLNYVPTNSLVPSPLRSLRTKFVDSANALEHWDKWKKSFDDVIKQGGR
jgi:iron(III) transport system substrate-binding protein